MSISPMRAYSARVLARLLPICLICVVLVATYGGIRKIESLSDASQKSAGTPATATPLTLEELKARLDDLKWILGLIVTAAGLFAVAQAAAAFFNAQTFTKQSEDAIKRIQDLEKDAEDRYPIFLRTEQSRKEAYRSLAFAFQDEGFDWRDRLYDKMPLRERQHLLSVERFVGLEFLPIRGSEIEFAHNLRRLANFYASKFLHEHERDFGNLADLERAEYYLHIARDLADDAFYMLNDLGLLYLEFHKPRSIETARSYFEKSLKKHHKQQRAHYNLAVAATYERKWEIAIASLEHALKHPVWERTPVSEMECSIHYNLGCAKARLFYRGGPGSDELFRSSLEALERAAEIGQVRKKTLDFDLDNPDGDLFEMLKKSDQKTAKYLNDLRLRLCLNEGRTQASKPNWSKRFDRAWNSMRGRF
jgi:hypothetical protein